ncbi:MAG: hypothetical protein ACYS8L_05290 [Planctomycetota bacterium]
MSSELFLSAFLEGVNELGRLADGQIGGGIRTEFPAQAVTSGHCIAGGPRFERAEAANIRRGMLPVKQSAEPHCAGDARGLAGAARYRHDAEAALREVCEAPRVA